MITKIERQVDNSLKILLLLLVILVLALTGCTVSKKSTLETVTKDSIVYKYKEKIVVKDSLIETIIPADKELIKAYFECDSLGQIQMVKIEELEAGKNVKAKIEYRDNIVYLDCDVDSLFVYSIFSQRFESITSDLSDSSSNVVLSTEKKRVLPWWVFPSLFGAAIVGVLIGLFIGKFL